MFQGQYQPGDHSKTKQAANQIAGPAPQPLPRATPAERRAPRAPPKSHHRPVKTASKAPQQTPRRVQKSQQTQTPETETPAHKAAKRPGPAPAGSACAVSPQSARPALLRGFAQPIRHVLQLSHLFKTRAASHHRISVIFHQYLSDQRSSIVSRR